MTKKQSQGREILTDAELAYLVQQGDGFAFTLLSERYSSVLHNRAARYANVAGVDLDDFVQEGMFALFRAAKGYSPGQGAQFGTYAITCINNSMSDAIKAHMRTLRRSSPVSIDDLELQVLPEARLPATSTNPVEDAYQDREDNTLRAAQIQILLSDFEQQVLKLYLRGHTYEQIASILSTATKAVDNALQRVRRKLRPEP